MRDIYTRAIGILRPATLLLPALLVVACGGATPTDADPPPAITVYGVEDGGVYHEAVTIEVSIDRGSWSARLNGDPFYSGATVSTLGRYTLEVTARASGLESTERLEFELAFTGDRVLIFRMIDLGPHVPWGGGGDALLLTDSSGAGLAHALVDAGAGGFERSNVQYDLVADRLTALGVDTLEFLQLTHAHADHYAGVQTVLERVHVRRFLYNGQLRTQTGYTQTLERAEQRADSVIILASPREYTLGAGTGATRTMHVHGLPDYLDEDTDDSRMLNEGSLATYVEQGDVRIFLTGDGEVRANDRWRTDFADYTRDLDILKVGHHGANNAVFDNRFNGSSGWLEHTDPGIMLISANGKTHPRHNALTKIMERTNTRTYCTNVHGNVEIRVNSEGRHAVTVEKNPGDDCVPGSEATS